MMGGLSGPGAASREESRRGPMRQWKSVVSGLPADAPDPALAAALKLGTLLDLTTTPKGLKPRLAEADLWSGIRTANECAANPETAESWIATTIEGLLAQANSEAPRCIERWRTAWAERPDRLPLGRVLAVVCALLGRYAHRGYTRGAVQAAEHVLFAAFVDAEEAVIAEWVADSARAIEKSLIGRLKQAAGA